MKRIKEFFKILEEDTTLLNLFTTLVCFAIIGIISIFYWMFG